MVRGARRCRPTPTFPACANSSCATGSSPNSSNPARRAGTSSRGGPRSPTTRWSPPTAIPAAQKNPSDGRAFTPSEVAGLVDHTLLKPEATDADVAALVAEAAELGRLRGVRVAVDGGRRQASCAPRACTIAIGRGIPVGQASFGDQGARGRARGRRRAPTRSTWSSTSAPPSPVNSTPCAPTSPRCAQRVPERRPQGDRRVGGAAGARAVSTRCVGCAGPPRTRAPTSSRPPPDFIPAAARRCVPSS